MRQTQQIHGHTVFYEKDEHHIDEGVRYLEMHLSREEAETFFSHAKDHNTSDFKSTSGFHYTLEHHTDGYNLMCRD